mgnify:CR=1 FL=1
MPDKTTTEAGIESSAAQAASVSVDGTQTVEHRLTEQIAADKYLRATRGRRRPGAGVIFQKIVPHGSVQ